RVALTVQHWDRRILDKANPGAGRISVLPFVGGLVDFQLSHVLHRHQCPFSQLSQVVVGAVRLDELFDAANWQPPFSLELHSKERPEIGRQNIKGQLPAAGAVKCEITERRYLPNGLLQEVRTLDVLCSKKHGVNQPVATIKFESDHISGAIVSQLPGIEI